MRNQLLQAGQHGFQAQIIGFKNRGIEAPAPWVVAFTVLLLPFRIASRNFFKIGRLAWAKFHGSAAALVLQQAMQKYIFSGPPPASFDRAVRPSQ